MLLLLTTTTPLSQACIQMTGLVAEWLHHGAASDGFRNIIMLERHLLLSQQPLSPGDFLYLGLMRSLVCCACCH